MSDAAAGRPRSAMSPRNSSSTGTRSRRWRCKICGRSSRMPARRVRERSASTRSRSARATAIVSWSATWFASGRSGSAARIVPRPAWRHSTAQEELPNQARCEDMWKPFRNVTKDKAPQAAILFDKFHIMRHLGEALDKVRKAEYARLSGRDRRFIKGQKYNLLSRHDNLTLEGRRSLKILLAANKRLNTAYILKEAFGQLWDYGREGWARRFFDNWRDSLKWKRLGPYERFADMIDRHWDGIAAYCKPENKVSLGFVEGLNNKIRVFQRRAYGLRDDEYLRLKVLTCMLPPL